MKSPTDCIPFNEPVLHGDVWKGLEATVPITKGRLDLGTCQRVFYVEVDGPRNKRLNVMVVGE